MNFKQSLSLKLQNAVTFPTLLSSLSRISFYLVGGLIWTIMWEAELDQFWRDIDSERRALVHQIASWISAEFGLSQKLRYRIPFFYHYSWICYLNPVKPEGFELAFIYGNELSNEGHLLRANGRKQVSGAILTHWTEEMEDLWRPLIHEAIILDEIKHQSKKK